MAGGSRRRLLLVAVMAAIGALAGGIVVASIVEPTGADATWPGYAGKVAGALLGWFLAVRMWHSLRRRASDAVPSPPSPVTAAVARALLVAVVAAAAACAGGALAAWWTAPDFGTRVVIAEHFRELLGKNIWVTHDIPGTQWDQASPSAVAIGLIAGGLLGWGLCWVGPTLLRVRSIRVGCGVAAAVVSLVLTGLLLGLYVIIRLGIDDFLPGVCLGAFVAVLPLLCFLLYRWRLRRRARHLALATKTREAPGGGG